MHGSQLSLCHKEPEQWEYFAFESSRPRRDKPRCSSTNGSGEHWHDRPHTDLPPPCSITELYVYSDDKISPDLSYHNRQHSPRSLPPGLSPPPSSPPGGTILATEGPAAFSLPSILQGIICIECKLNLNIWTRIPDWSICNLQHLRILW